MPVAPDRERFVAIGAAPLDLGAAIGPSRPVERPAAASSAGRERRVAFVRRRAPTEAGAPDASSPFVLDDETTRVVLDVLGEVDERSDVTIVVVAHDPSVPRSTSARVVMKDDGSIVEDTRPTAAVRVVQSSPALDTAFARTVVPDAASGPPTTAPQRRIGRSPLPARQASPDAGRFSIEALASRAAVAGRGWVCRFPSPAGRTVDASDGSTGRLDGIAARTRRVGGLPMPLKWLPEADARTTTSTVEGRPAA